LPLPLSRSGRLALLYGATGLLLLAPPGRHPSRWLFLAQLAVVLGGVALLFLPDRRPRRSPARTLRVLCRVYVVLVAVSALLHGLALDRLRPDTEISIAGLRAGDALGGVPLFALYYLLLPAAIAFGLELFDGLQGRARATGLLPLVAAPSAGVALVQAAGARSWLNVAFFAERGQSAGLAHDANSLAAALALLLPWGLLGLAASKRQGRRLAIVVALLLAAAGIWVAGSRAGLVAALVLLAAGAPAAARAAGDHARRWAAPLVAGTLALVAIALALAPRAGAGGRLSSTFELLGSEGVRGVAEDSGRLHYSRQALRLIGESPLAGWGPGGYLRQLDNVRYRHGEAPLRFVVDNATNSYLEVGAELGVPAALLFATLLGLPLAASWRRREPGDEVEGAERSVARAVLTVVAPLLLLNHYVILPDVSWLIGLWIALAATVSARAPAVASRRAPARAALVLGLVALLFAAASWPRSFGNQGYGALARSGWWPSRAGSSCYEIEDWDPDRGRWCGREGRWLLPVRATRLRVLRLRVRVGHPDVAADPVEVRLAAPPAPAVALSLSDAEWHDVTLAVAPRSVVPCVDERRRLARCVALGISASRTFVPADLDGGSDTRELGVAVVPVGEVSERVFEATPEDRARLLFTDGFESGSESSWNGAPVGAGSPAR